MKWKSFLLKLTLGIVGLYVLLTVCALNSPYESFGLTPNAHKRVLVTILYHEKNYPKNAAELRHRIRHDPKYRKYALLSKHEHHPVDYIVDLRSYLPSGKIEANTDVPECHNKLLYHYQAAQTPDDYPDLRLLFCEKGKFKTLTE